jgi:hypothetical protein
MRLLTTQRDSDRLYLEQQLELLVNKMKLLEENSGKMKLLEEKVQGVDVRLERLEQNSQGMSSFFTLI